MTLHQPTLPNFMKNANQAKIYFNQGTAKVLSAESLAHVGRMSDAYREIEGAIKDYSSAIDLEPENAILWSAKGYALLHLGDTLDAGEHFEKSIELDPSLAESHYQLGLCFFEHYLPQEGYKKFNDALALHENKNELKRRFYEDIIYLIRKNLFYTDEILKMGHTENIPRMAADTINIIRLAETLDHADQRLIDLLKHASSLSKVA